MKLTFNPAYATANTVRFDEQVNTSDWLAKPILGSIYIPHEQLPALGLSLKAGEEYAAPGANGKVYKRRDVTGDSFTVTISKA